MLVHKCLDVGELTLRVRAAGDRLGEVDAMCEVVLDPFKVQRHQFLIVIVGEGVVGADLLQRGDVPAVGVGGLDDDHVEERPVGASPLCEFHDVPAMLTRTTKAWWHLILSCRSESSNKSL